jgi:hypothetical protein
MASFTAAATALHDLSSELHWWQHVGSEDRELWSWMSVLWPGSAEDLEVVDLTMLLRPLLCNSLSCIDVASLYNVMALRDRRECVSTQLLPTLLDDALAQQSLPLVDDAFSAVQAMGMHAHLQVMQPLSNNAAERPRLLDFYSFLSELYSPEGLAVLRLHEGKLSAALSEHASPVEVPVFGWMDDELEVADSGAGAGSPLWDSTDSVSDARLEWRSAVVLLKALGVVDLLPLSVLRTITREVLVHLHAHWLVRVLVARGLPRAEALRAVHEAAVRSTLATRDAWIAVRDNTLGGGRAIDSNLRGEQRLRAIAAAASAAQAAQASRESEDHLLWEEGALLLPTDTAPAEAAPGPAAAKADSAAFRSGPSLGGRPRDIAVDIPSSPKHGAGAPPMTPGSRGAAAAGTRSAGFFAMHASQSTSAASVPMSHAASAAERLKSDGFNPMVVISHALTSHPIFQYIDLPSFVEIIARCSCFVFPEQVMLSLAIYAYAELFAPRRVANPAPTPRAD